MRIIHPLSVAAWLDDLLLDVNHGGCGGLGRDPGFDAPPIPTTNSTDDC
jgi:hypothetical protein